MDCSVFGDDDYAMTSPLNCPPVDSDRDVFNEKPTKEDIVASATETKGAVARLYEQGLDSVENFGLNFGMKIGLRIQFYSVTWRTFPFLNLILT